VDQTLLGILGALVLAMTWVLKRQSMQIDRSIRSLTQAVDSFRCFEQSESVAHAQIVSGLADITETQRRIIEIQERILSQVTK
jgi:hypothetical protein